MFNAASSLPLNVSRDCHFSGPMKEFDKWMCTDVKDLNTELERQYIKYEGIEEALEVGWFRYSKFNDSCNASSS